MSKAFSKSIATKIQGRSFSLVYSIKSSIVLIASKIDLLLTNAFWLECIISGKSFSKRFASVLEAIFASTLIKDISNHPFIYSFLFYIKVIMACFYEFESSPNSKANSLPNKGHNAR